MKWYPWILAILISFNSYCDDKVQIPSAEELLGRIESNKAYQKVLKNGFSGENQGLDLAILEVMATKELTVKTAGKLNDVQLDLTGFVMAYGKRENKIPEKLFEKFKQSPSLRYTIKQATVFEERMGEFMSYTCFTPGMDPVVTFPEDHDVELDNGKKYAKIVNLDKVGKGVAEILLTPRALLSKTKKKMDDGPKFDLALDKYKPFKLGDSNIKASDIQGRMSSTNSKTVWVTVHTWNIQQYEPLADGKGVVLNLWSSQNAAPPLILKIPFKQFMDHAKIAGWEGKMTPGCEDGDSIEVIAEFKGKTTVTNKLGMLLEVAVLEAVAVNDEYSFYGK